MKWFLVSFLVTLNYIPGIFSWNKYCDLSCGSAHVLCMREPCPKGRACGSNFKILPLGYHERNYVTDLHNGIRNRLATNADGKLKYQIANMCALAYDIELEFVAQCLANSCFAETFENYCRETTKHRSVSENNFYYPPKQNISLAGLMEKAVNFWNEGNTTVTDLVIDALYLVKYKSMTNYINLVWAMVSNIGCGRSYNDLTGYLLICLYSPGPQKYPGQPVYERGPAKSNCAFCERGPLENENYEGLCGYSTYLGEDFIQPFHFPLSSAVKNEYPLVFMIIHLYVSQNYY